MARDKCWFFECSSSHTTARGCMIWLLLMLSCAMMAAQGCPERPGCHLIGFSSNFSLPNCESISFRGNACCGYCESWAFPSGSEHLEQNPNQHITSVSQCCDMEETQDVSISLRCVDGTKKFTLKSAKSCKCSQCKKDPS